MDMVIVSRHEAAVEWIHKTLDIPADTPVISGNATPDDVRGKIVIGNIPMALAAITSTVWAVEFDGPPPRGSEYTVEQMKRAGARIVPYMVFSAPAWADEAEALWVAGLSDGLAPALQGRQWRRCHQPPFREDE